MDKLSGLTLISVIILFLILFLSIAYLYENVKRSKNIYNYPFEKYHTFSEIIQIGGVFTPFILNIVEDFRPWIVHLPNNKEDQIPLNDTFNIKRWAVYKNPYWSCVTKNNSAIMFDMFPRISDINLSIFTNNFLKSEDGGSFNYTYSGTATETPAVSVEANLTILSYFYYNLNWIPCNVYVISSLTRKTVKAENINRKLCLQTLIGIFNFILNDIKSKKLTYFIITGFSDLYSSEWKFVVSKLFTDNFEVYISPGVKENYITEFNANKKYYATYDFILVNKAFTEPVWGLIYADWIPFNDRFTFALRVGITTAQEVPVNNKRHREQLIERFAPYTKHALTVLNDAKIHDKSILPEPDAVPADEIKDVDFTFTAPLMNSSS